MTPWRGLGRSPHLVWRIAKGRRPEGEHLFFRLTGLCMPEPAVESGTRQRRRLRFLDFHPEFGRKRDAVGGKWEQQLHYQSENEVYHVWCK
jgi:hypothetical protein